jgi:GT2 family glycosyltransferase
MLQQIGLFDNDFFAYYEDIDISFRAQLVGWKVRYQPNSIAYHRIGATTSKMSGFAAYHTAKNIPLLYLKNMPCGLYFKDLPFAAYWYLRMFAANTVRGKFWPFTKGFLMSIYLTPKKLIERYKIQKSRTVSVKYIDSIIYHVRPPKPPRI